MFFTLKGICLADNSKRSAEPEPKPKPDPEPSEVNVFVNDEDDLHEYFKDDGNILFDIWILISHA